MQRAILTGSDINGIDSFLMKFMKESTALTFFRIVMSLFFWEIFSQLIEGQNFVLQVFLLNRRDVLDQLMLTMSPG